MLARRNRLRRVVGNLQSRAPWDHDLVTDLPTFTTMGNNAETASNWAHQSAPDPATVLADEPLSVTTRIHGRTRGTRRTARAPGRRQCPASRSTSRLPVTNLFVAHNRMHDWAYGLGFNEVNWNAQKRNFGLTEAWQQGDPVTGNAQAGAGLTTSRRASRRNNANMATLADGLSSITNMYLWQPHGGRRSMPPCVDGDYDMRDHRPRVRPHDREPHDREGPHPARAATPE